MPEVAEKTAIAETGNLSAGLYNEVLKRMGAEGSLLKPMAVEPENEDSTRVESLQTATERRAEDSAALPAEVTETEEEKTAREEAEAKAEQQLSPTIPVEFTPEQEEAVALKVTEATTKATEELQTKLAEAEAKISELTEKAEQQLSPAPTSGRVHPLLLADNPQDVEKYHAEFQRIERWASKHGEGYGPDSEGWKDGHQELSGAQVREYFTQMKQEHDEIVPAARARLQLLQQAQPIIKEKYPALYDKKSEDYKFAQSILAAFPEMKSDYTAMLLIGDALAGRKARQAREKATAEAAKKNSAGTPNAARETRAIPTNGKAAAKGGSAPAPGSRSALTPRTTTTTSPFQDKIALDKLMEQRGSAESLKKMLFPNSRN